MEIFIVLFWGIIWAVRIIVDKYKSAKADREIKADIHAWETAMERWVSEVCDKELEDEVEYFVYDPKNMSEVRQTVLKAFAEAEMTHLNFDKTDAIRVYLAKQGKLMMHDARHGISVKSGEQTSIGMKKEMQDRRQFVFWINSRLIDHGICEDIFIQNYGTHQCYSLNDKDHIGGYYMWRPSIYPSDLNNL